MHFRVLNIGNNPKRLETTKTFLELASYQVITRLGQPLDLYQQVQQTQPDIIVIDIESPSHDCFAHIQKINQQQPMPIVIFTEQEDPYLAKQAVRVGVSAYVVDGLQAHRIRPILEIAIERFKQQQSLHGELENAKNRLAERKLVDRAKGVVMQQRSCSEQEAYHSLRKLAMKSNKRLAEVAEAVIAAAELFSDE